MYDLLIISPEEFKEQTIPLVKHKNNIGIKTKIITTNEVYDHIYWKGRDKAEKIKYFIKEAYEYWGIKYVLLMGGRKGQLPKEEWWVPVRYSYLNRNYENYPEGKFLTDLYFADLYYQNGSFSSWDDNKNGIFGEWLKDGIAVDRPDLHPDVYVGRLSCRNNRDVKIAVNKIINYETANIYESWFKKMIVVAGDTYPNKTPGFIDGEVHTQKALDNMTGFEPVKLWVSNGNLKNWIDIVKAFNKGAGFVFFSGHGGPHLWNTFFPDTSSKNAIIYLRHMSLFFNKNKLPVIVSSSGCFNNMFNVSLGHSEWVYIPLPSFIPKITEILFNQWISTLPLNIPYCWGEKLVFNPHGGGISVIASTAFSYESSDILTKEGGCEWLDIYFFEQYGKNNYRYLGECWGKTVDAFLQNFTINYDDDSSTGSALILKNLEQWLLLGDPSLKIGGYN